MTDLGKGACGKKREQVWHMLEPRPNAEKGGALDWPLSTA